MAPSTPTPPTAQRATRASNSLPSSVRVRHNSNSDNRSTVSALTAGSPPSVLRTSTATASASSTTAATSTATIIQEDDPSLQAEIEQFLSHEVAGGDGGDSDEEGDELVIHDEAVVKSRDRSSGIELDSFDERGKVKGAVTLMATGGTKKIGEVVICAADDTSATGLVDAKIGN